MSTLPGPRDDDGDNAAFLVPLIVTDEDGNHADAAGVEHVAVVIDGELTYLPTASVDTAPRPVAVVAADATARTITVHLSPAFDRLLDGRHDVVDATLEAAAVALHRHIGLTAYPNVLDEDGTLVVEPYAARLDHSRDWQVRGVTGDADGRQVVEACACAAQRRTSVVDVVEVAA